MLLGFPLRLTLDAMNPPLQHLPRAGRQSRARGLHRSASASTRATSRCRPAAASARRAAIARAYSVFADRRTRAGAAPETLDLLAAPAIPPARGFYDECLKGEVQFSLGFMKPSPAWPFGTPSAFGSPGAGGSMGFADPAAGVGYAYVTSQMGTSLTGDPRDVALRHALDTAASVNRPSAHAA